MKIDTLLPLVDVQPAYDALVELKDGRGLHVAEAKGFLRAKLAECSRSLRETADYLDEQLEILSGGP